MKFYKNEKILCFVGGILASFAAAKIYKSKKAREICVLGIAKGMKIQQDAQVALQNMKEDAQDLCYEAKQKAQEEL